MLDLGLYYGEGEMEAEAPPPSYYDSQRSNVKNTTVMPPNVTHQQEQPPTTNWLVRSSTDPSTWQLFRSGKLMSNVTTSHNDAPASKRRYRILYPPQKYEDVYLHKSPWSSQTTAFPRYHVEVHLRQDHYSPEAIVILGPPKSEDNSPLTAETKDLGSLHIQRTVSAVEDQVKAMRRQATTACMEFDSLDWTCTTRTAKRDMRKMISKAHEECVDSEGLVGGLEDFLAFIGSNVHGELLTSLRASCEDVRLKLEPLRLNLEE